MKGFFNTKIQISEQTDFEQDEIDLKKAIEKTREALEVAYSGFDNAVETELIDSYIYEINSLQKRYQFLLERLSQQPSEEKLHKQSPIRALVSHVFG